VFRLFAPLRVSRATGRPVVKNPTKKFSRSGFRISGTGKKPIFLRCRVRVSLFGCLATFRVPNLMMGNGDLRRRMFFFIPKAKLCHARGVAGWVGWSKPLKTCYLVSTAGGRMAPHERPQHTRPIARTLDHPDFRGFGLRLSKGFKNQRVIPAPPHGGAVVVGTDAPSGASMVS